jgi:hypothetical protein
MKAPNGPSLCRLSPYGRIHLVCAVWQDNNAWIFDVIVNTGLIQYAMNFDERRFDGMLLYRRLSRAENSLA